jgi:hypothetical protein
MEHFPEPIANAHWLTPDRQVPHAEVLMEAHRDVLTATFGTEHPPRGVSGLLRTLAYQIPDYRPRHWLLLIMADRVDTLESDLGRAMKRPATWLTVAAAASIWLLVRHTRRS